MQIPGYRIERELGHGGMATVYLAEQESLGRKVALKVMAAALSADRSFSDRFIKEARTVAQLSHPHIVSIYDVGVVDHHHYLTLEYVSGGDLKKRLRQGPLPEAEAVEIFRQIASALNYAHEKGYVHRDVKPENILFREDGSVVLTDFGIAKAVGSGTRMTGTGMSIGTPHYMSPEQARGRQVDGCSDLYSLGVVFYEMLTGALPYEAEDSYAVSLMHINDPIPTLPPKYSKYREWLNTALAKHAVERYESLTLASIALCHLLYVEKSMDRVFTQSTEIFVRSEKRFKEENHVQEMDWPSETDHAYSKADNEEVDYRIPQGGYEKKAIGYKKNAVRVEEESKLPNQQILVVLLVGTIWVIFIRILLVVFGEA